ncbi:MAG: polysaccharide deacetylase family protein, partial [Betaproteobacteria bacterium]
DEGSEQFLSEMFNPPSFPDRHMTMESIYEYGSRAGVWRILREFDQRKLPLTVFGVGMALERHKELAQAFVAKGHEIACHGYRWINHQAMPESTEREHIRKGIDIVKHITQETSIGWYTGRDSPNTRRLVADCGDVGYDSDYYGDDLPFWMKVQNSAGKTVPQLIVPYTLDCNDMRFSLPQGYAQAQDFFIYLKDTFDALYAEGDDCPKMMSVGMHCRLLGRPGRIMALKRFLDYIETFDRVWVCKRMDIAKHWRTEHPFLE